MTRRLGVLISGRGSNLQALVDAIADRRLDAEIVLVLSNREDAPGLERARNAGLDARCISHRGWATRDEYDGEIVRALRAKGVEIVCLAGFMRLIGTTLLEAFPNAILNIHPSLLPAFPGLDPQRQALEHGVKVTGVTVHVVNGELDAGPIVLQRPVPVRDDDTRDTLAARILEQEHLAYPEAVAMVMSGRWRLDGRRFLSES